MQYLLSVIRRHSGYVRLESWDSITKDEGERLQEPWNILERRAGLTVRAMGGDSEPLLMKESPLTLDIMT